MAAKQDTPLAKTVYDRDELTPDLKYEWVEPNPPKGFPNSIEWHVSNEVARQQLVAYLIDMGWRVDDFRDKIAEMGGTPRGRRRQELVEQFVALYLDPQRIVNRVSNLGAETRRFLPYLLLGHELFALRTMPVMNMLPRPGRGGAFQSLVQAGLALQDPYGDTMVPFEALRYMPPVSIDCATVPEPDQFVPAPDPQFLTTHIQHWLTLIQSGTYKQRARACWSPPQMVYMGRYLIWPPTPESAKKLIKKNNFQGELELCALPPSPEQPALDDWSAKLGIAPDMAEFIYNAMVFGQVVLTGSPITLDPALAQKWMMQTPGEQIVALYHLYCGLRTWGPWWPLWRSGRIRVFWNYQNYWQITAVDEMLQSVTYTLQWVLLEILAYLPQEAWLSLDTVIAFVKSLYPNPNTHLYLTELVLKGDESWEGFLRLALQAILTGPLHLMGFVDIAPDLEAPAYFRLRHLQDIHWGRLTEMPSTHKQLLSVEKLTFKADEALLLIAPPVSPSFLAFVQRWARSTGFSANLLHYTLDLERLHAAFENGETPDTLIQTWKENADFEPLPGIVAWWRHWGARYGHVRIYSRQATLMTRDEFTMREIQAAIPALRESVLGLITPHTALLRPDHVDAIVSGLKRQGYMPKEEA